MNASVLDTLVKLASLGASGVCVLAVFWVGWLISKLSDTASREKHRTVRLYMAMTLCIAVIAFASGIANAWFNATVISKVEQEKTQAETRTVELDKELNDYKSKTETMIANLKVDQARSKAIVESLSMVVDEKELASREQDASPELKSHIRILKKSIEDLRTMNPGVSVPDSSTTNPP